MSNLYWKCNLCGEMYQLSVTKYKLFGFRKFGFISPRMSITWEVCNKCFEGAKQALNAYADQVKKQTTKPTAGSEGVECLK